MNNCTIPATHTKKNYIPFWITLFYSISLSWPYRQTELQRHKYTHCAWAGETFFPVVLLCQFLVLGGKRCWFYILMYLESIQLWCCVSFCFWQDIVFGVTYVLSVQYSLCGCVSFLVVEGKWSQNENTFQQKKLLGLLFYDHLLANVCIS